MNDRANAEIIRTIVMIPIVIVFLYVIVLAFAPAIDIVVNDMWGNVDQSNQFYSTDLHDDVTGSFVAWHTYVIITAVMGFVFLIVLVYRRQRYSRGDQFEEYYE